jgi:cytochrome c553
VKALKEIIVKKNRSRFLMPMLVSFLIVTTADAGGWAIVTVNELPDYAVAGKPFTVTFTIRQHGVHPLDGLKPTVHARTAGGPQTTVSATPTGNAGQYVAMVKVSQAADWKILIDTGFAGVSTRAVASLPVVEDGHPAPPALSPIARGERLFVAKGCIGCHRHQEITEPNLVPGGPDLTAQRFPPAYLAQFLVDPSKTLKRSGKLESGQMPNLNLNEPEIAALAAFINRDR